MNILMIGELYRYGGASEIMEVIADNMRSKGHNVISVYGYNYKNKKIDNGNYVLFQNKYIRGINNRLLPLIEKFDLINLYTRIYIEIIIKRERIDIINFHAMQGGFISLKDIEYFSKKNNVIWTIHDTWEFTGGCMYYGKCNKWIDRECIGCSEKDILGVFKDTHKNFKRKKEKLCGKNIFYISPSKWMYDNIKQSFLKMEKLICIENGINLDKFYPLKDSEVLRYKYQISQDKNVLMFAAGNIKNKYKGWKYLIEALKLIEYPEKYELLVVGESNSDLESLNIETKIVGFVDDKAVLNELYNISDVFIIPSVQDNFPTVSLEAQAAGTPVIAFPTGGIKEQIDKETGWLLSEISSREMAETINGIFMADDFRDNLRRKGANARCRCEKLYSQGIMCNKYEKIYLGRNYENNR